MACFELSAQRTSWQTWKTWKDLPAFIRNGLLSEKAIWKKGFQAAKKKIWHKESLNSREQRYYKAFLKHVGGVLAATTIFAILSRSYIQKQGNGPSLFTIEQAKQMPAEKWNKALLNADLDDYATLRALVIAGRDDEAKDIDVADEDGWTALLLASKKGNMQAVRLLLENGAQTDVKDEAKGFTPLIVATDEGHLGVVKLLADPPYNVNVNEADTFGRTPLMIASQKGHNDIIENLVQRGADINQRQEEYGTTPLVWAVQGGRQSFDNIDKTVKLLLDHGADATIEGDVMSPMYNHIKGTPLEVAREVMVEFGREQRGSYEEAIKLLEQAAASKKN